MFFDVAYQSYLPSVVDRDQLVEGNSKLEITPQRVADPGARAWRASSSACCKAPFAMLLDSLSYLVSAVFLFFIRRPPAWEVSARLSFLSGRPFTPYDQAVSTAQRRGVYDLTRVNAERAPDYGRVDIRVDRTFTVGGQPLNL